MQDCRETVDLSIQQCRPDDIDWGNSKYHEIDFKPSRLEGDRTAIAICNGERIGIGRLCRVEDSIFELGGMYVESAYRGEGVARQIVRFLLSHRELTERVYCLPFAHLKSFYESEGFEIVGDEGLFRIPKGVLEKHRWCNQIYQHEVLLLELHTPLGSS